MKNLEAKWLLITMGDPAGIGPEIILHSLCDQRIAAMDNLLVVGSEKVLRRSAAISNCSLAIRPITSVDAISAKTHDELLLWNVDAVSDCDWQPGVITGECGRAAYRYIEAAIRLAADLAVAGVITAPIHKQSLRAAGITLPGHTEILQSLCQADQVYTMFIVEKLRVFFYTRHLSLRQAIAALAVKPLAATLVAMHHHLQRLNFKSPRLALAALNPHASDGGLFGNEETEILEPAVAMAREQGIDAYGPVPADSVFYQAGNGKYTAVLSLYHDQGHIACKTYDFERTISVTLGLPFIRTSVDHGTAFDIAGQGIASSVSMQEAIIQCAKLATAAAGVS